MTQRPHGYARYRLDGCRCYVCGYARAQYDDNRNRAIAYGTWQPWTDAAPVRAHIQTLQSCEMGLRRIALAARCDRKRLQAITTGRPERGAGPQDKVRPSLAAAILSADFAGYPSEDEYQRHEETKAKRARELERAANLR